MPLAATLYTWGVAGQTATVALDADSRATPNARDYAFDHQTGRFLRSASGGRYLTTGLEAIRQAVNIRLLTFLGEWFLDVTRGVPYFQTILGVKSPDLVAIKAALTAQILDVQGVNSITSVVLAFDSTARLLSVAWTADTTLGAISGSTVLPS